MGWKEAVFTIITSVLCSVIATYVFWSLSSRAPTTKVVFSPYIERSYRGRRYKLRIKFINTGPADLFDVRYVARLFYNPRISAERLGAGTVAYLNVGQRSMSPIIYGRRKQNQNPKTVYSWTTALGESDDFYRVFSREYNPDHIRAKANAKTLTFDDVFDEYKDNIHIRVFAFGTDSMTGIEKMFASPIYWDDDIINGRFNSSRVKFRNYKDYLSYILTVNPSKIKDETNPKNTPPLPQSDLSINHGKLDEKLTSSDTVSAITRIERMIEDNTKELQELKKLLLARDDELEKPTTEKDSNELKKQVISNKPNRRKARKR